MLECNTTAAKEHVSEAEQRIHTIKEHVRGLIIMLPFEHIPWRLTVEFIYFFMLWLNGFPVQSRVSEVHSPHKLLVWWRMDYKRHCPVVPGTYCEVHDELLTFNTMTACMHEAIAVGLTRNLKGIVKFFCLKTG